MKEKFFAIQSKIDDIFENLKIYNDETMVAFQSLKTRLDYYLNLTEKTFEFDIK